MATGGPGGAAISTFHWMSETASGSRLGYSRGDVATGSQLWFRIEDDGANYRTYFSLDGQNFFQQFSSAYLAGDRFVAGPDEIGFFAQAGGTGYDCITTLIHWDKPSVASAARYYGFWGPLVSVQSGASHVGAFS